MPKVLAPPSYPALFCPPDPPSALGEHFCWRPRTLLLVLALIAAGCGPPDGPFEEYYENGQLEQRGTYAAGERDGPYERYYENRQLGAKATIVAGELDGPFESYYDNGQLWRRGTYNMGEDCGEWISWGETVTYDPCPPGN